MILKYKLDSLSNHWPRYYRIYVDYQGIDNVFIFDATQGTLCDEERLIQELNQLPPEPDRCQVWGAINSTKVDDHDC